jgi:dienelactone hydrolase
MSDQEPGDSRREFLTRATLGSAAICATAAWAGPSAATAQVGPAIQGDGTAGAPGAKPASADTQSLRRALVECLGGDWPEPCPLNPTIIETIRKPGYRIESLTYEVEPGDRVPAMLLVPDGVSANSPAPAVAIWHQHNGEYHLGKTEPAGLAGNPMHHTGAELAKLGYVVLCPDALCFEERQDPEKKLAGGNYERFEFLRYVVAGQSMAWKNVLDMRRAVDYLCERPEVKADRIGCYGHSMGSTHAWLVGPHEPRIKAVVGNCCLPTYAAIHDTKLLHCFPNFVPGWLKFGDTPEMAGLIAPRALHLNLGETDGGSPIEHAKVGIERIRKMYAAQGAEDRFSHFIEPDTGHVLSPEMWRRTHEFFAKYLG